jgi:hypothetical protein
MGKTFPKPLSKLTWIWFTTAGWFAGFAFTLLIGLPLEALGIGNQSMIGIGMGAGVGLLQALLLRRYGISGKIWFWTSFIGMSIPYILFDLLAEKIKMRPEEVLPIITAIGSLLMGVLQYNFQVALISKNSKSWIVVNCVGWTLAHILLNALDFNFIKQLNLPVFFNVLLAVVLIMGGGPVLGLITSRSIVSILKSHEKMGLIQ